MLITNEKNEYNRDRRVNGLLFLQNPICTVWCTEYVGYVLGFIATYTCAA